MTITRQQSLFPQLIDVVIHPKPVNVSSVPQRSPFRYPGGKTWFVPVFRNWLAKNSVKPALLVEPFAGGGIITLTALFENLVQSAVMVELDEDIAAVWQAVVDGHAEWLAKRIKSFDLTMENLQAELSKDAGDFKERAFQTILKNRTNHGGILAAGSGLLKHGENGKGIRSRWYPETLARRFAGINQLADKIDFRPTGWFESH
ncbi:DNA adenine methylase [Chlorobium sp. KB01]|uniref:DNA adenine methylase n=1 Tax=Chlorobium sp. KB01 TaxID=1917528 RepID=UPI001E608D3C|nr:DNA adenine methylase [Chlorobium sp. KB01]